MRSMTLAAGLLMVSVLSGRSSAQLIVDQKLDACGLSISFLAQIRDGADTPKGVEIYPRLKPEDGYKTQSERALFIFDGYREFGDVRANCRPERWPPEVSEQGLKRTIRAAVQTDSQRFCRQGTDGLATPASLIPTWLADARIRWFEDRVLELTNRLDPLDASHQTIDRHVSDSEWLQDASRELVAACGPDAEVKMALEAADLSLSIANEHAAFRDCVKARERYKPAMDAFDAAAKAQDATLMKTAYAVLENSAEPVRTSCKSSDEGAREVDYILASRKMQIPMLELVSCRPAVIAMNDQRQAMGALPRDEIPLAVDALRHKADAAKTACGNDISPQIWGEFVAWITELNLTRLP